MLRTESRRTHQPVAEIVRNTQPLIVAVATFVAGRPIQSHRESPRLNASRIAFGSSRMRTNPCLPAIEFGLCFQYFTAQGDFTVELLNEKTSRATERRARASP